MDVNAGIWVSNDWIMSYINKHNPRADEITRKNILKGSSALNKLQLWTWLQSYETPGFMIDISKNVIALESAMRFSSASSFGVTMRYLQHMSRSKEFKTI